MMDRLENKGLVQRRPALNDQRGVELSLTDEGRAVQKRLGRIHVRGIHELLAPSLSPEELVQLKALTDKLLAGLQPEAKSNQA